MIANIKIDISFACYLNKDNVALRIIRTKDTVEYYKHYKNVVVVDNINEAKSFLIKHMDKRYLISIIDFERVNVYEVKEYIDSIVKELRSAREDYEELI
jgi:hypothetical protein